MKTGTRMAARDEHDKAREELGAREELEYRDNYVGGCESSDGPGEAPERRPPASGRPAA